jgi:protein required for attachment to host cells
MSNCWVLVANSSRALIYMSDKKLAKLEVVRTLSHPESRLKNGEINSDAQGQTLHAPSRTSASYSAEHDPHEHEVEVFAKEVARVLHLGRTDGSFDELILVASPKFLGFLRSHLDADTARKVSESIHHDWTGQNARELADSIRGALGAGGK